MQDQIRAVVVEMIDSFAARGEVDMAWDFARVYPVRIFMGLMGFPPAMFEQFLDLFGLEQTIFHQRISDALPETDLRTATSRAIHFLRRCPRGASPFYSFVPTYVRVAGSFLRKTLPSDRSVRRGHFCT